MTIFEILAPKLASLPFGKPHPLITVIPFTVIPFVERFVPSTLILKTKKKNNELNCFNIISLILPFNSDNPTNLNKKCLQLKMKTSKGRTTKLQMVGYL